MNIEKITHLHSILVLRKIEWASKPILSFKSGRAWFNASLWAFAFPFLLCITSRAENPPAAAAPASAPIGNTSSIISPMDMVQISVFQEDDLKSTLRVANDGTVVFPFVGSIAIADKTPQEAALLIQGRLKPDYLVDPQVTITITEFAKRRFTVLGQVQRSGSYDMPDHETITLLEAIAMAGGYTRLADSAKITVKRKIHGIEDVTVLNAKKMAHESGGRPFAILPDDIITVAESAF